MKGLFLVFVILLVTIRCDNIFEDDFIALVDVKSTTAVYNILNGHCAQLELEDKYVPEAIKEGLKVGTCASVGWTVHDHDEQVKLPPPLGEVTVGIWLKPSVEVKSTTAVYNILNGHCAQLELEDKWLPNAKQAGLKVGTCASVGYTIHDHDEQVKLPPIGEVTVGIWLKPSVEVKSTTTVYMLKNGHCGQLDLDDKYLPEAKVFGAKVGTCSSVGYTVHDHDEQVKLPPPLGETTVGIWLKPSVEVKGTTTVHKLMTDKFDKGNTYCIQTDAKNELLPLFAKQNCKEGTCASIGYTLHYDDLQMHFNPPLGWVPVSVWNTSSTVDVEATTTVYMLKNGHFEPSAEVEATNTTTVFLIKNMQGTKFCAQTDANNDDLPKFAKHGFKEGTCNSTGFTHYLKDEKVKLPPIIGMTTFSIWGPTPPPVEVKSTTTVYVLKNGHCGQLDLDDKYLPEAKAFGAKVGTCASVGYTVHDHDETVKLPPPLGDTTVQIWLKPSFIEAQFIGFK